MAGTDKSWYAKRCGIGVGVGLAAVLIACMLFALLTVRGIVPEVWEEKIVLVSVMLSSLCACTVSGRGTVKCAAMAAATAVVFLLALVLMGLAIFGGVYVGRILHLTIAIFLGGALSLCSKQKGKGNRRKSGGEHKARKRAKR